jgi:hypothetical protein
LPKSGKYQLLLPHPILGGETFLIPAQGKILKTASMPSIMYVLRVCSLITIPCLWSMCNLESSSIITKFCGFKKSYEFAAVQSFFLLDLFISLLLLIVFCMQLCPLLLFFYLCDLVWLFLLLCFEISTFENKICIIQCLKLLVFLRKHHELLS